ncbi:hypothetical protein Tco_1310224 [Tanacetum coccineum]
MNYISGLKVALQIEVLSARPTTLVEAFSLASLIEARFEVIAEKEHVIKKKADTTISLPSEEASPKVKGSLDANEDISVDEVNSVIDGAFVIGESNVKSMEVRSKFGEFSENEKSVEEVVVCGGEALGLDKDELNRVILVVKDGDGEFDERLDDKNLDLSQEFVISVLESRNVYGRSLVVFLKLVYREKNCKVFSVTCRWESCGSGRRNVVEKTAEDGRTFGSDRESIKIVMDRLSGELMKLSSSVLEDDLEPSIVNDSDSIVSFKKRNIVNGRNCHDKIDAQNVVDKMSLNKFLANHDSSGIEKEGDCVMDFDVDCTKIGSRVSEIDDDNQCLDDENTTVENAPGYNGEQEVGIEAELKVNPLANNNKWLVVCGMFGKDDDEIMKDKNRKTLSNLVLGSGEIIDGPKGSELDRSIMRRSLANEHQISVLEVDKKNGFDPDLVVAVGGLKYMACENHQMGVDESMMIDVVDIRKGGGDESDHNYNMDKVCDHTSDNVLGYLVDEVERVNISSSKYGDSNYEVINVYDVVENFSKNEGKTKANKLVEMYNGKYDENKEEDNDLIASDLVLGKSCSLEQINDPFSFAAMNLDLKVEKDSGNFIGDVINVSENVLAHLVSEFNDSSDNIAQICYATYINAYKVRHRNNWTFATLRNVYFDTS